TCPNSCIRAPPISSTDRRHPPLAGGPCQGGPPSRPRRDARQNQRATHSMERSTVTWMSRFRNVGILAAGTAVSQLIAFAVAPLLSRMYTPADFGLFGVFVSVVAMASVIVTLRLDLAVVVPE